MGTPPHGDDDWLAPERPEDDLSWDIELPERSGPLSAPERRRRRVRRSPEARRRRSELIRRRRIYLGGGLGLVVLVIVLVVVLAGSGGGGGLTGPPLPGLGHPARSGDPFGYDSGQESAFEQRAAAGNAQVLFTKSPGGAIATAARVAKFRSQIEAAVKGTSIPADTLEAMVFVESAGRPDVIAGTNPEAASGLTQILASTGTSLLGMRINLAESTKLTGQINAAQGRQQAKLVAKRAQIDDRFDPAKALAATVRYLRIAESHFGGRLDLAVESYHMGIGNLQQVLGDYGQGDSVPYAQVYFDTAPDDHASAYKLLSGFSDDSELYYWRVLGAETIMHQYRTDRSALKRLQELELGFPSNALTLVPKDTVPRYETPSDLSKAYDTGQLLPLPRNAAQLGLAYAPSMGSLAVRLKVPRGLYSGLRPAALDMLIELVARIHQISGTSAPLTVASTVADAEYESHLGFSDAPALTGYTFQIERRYASTAEAVAFQSMLDRLQSLNLIAWIHGDQTIEITVNPDADSVIENGVK